MQTRTIASGDIQIEVKLKGAGPVIVCAHSWPELWYSWRHQMAHVSGRGHMVAVMHVRGSGASSKPAEIAAYSMRNLASDVAAAISDDPLILFGHDWGAPIVYNAALLYPDGFRAIAASRPPV
jgi:pimeloyl-ACP methyl ester carboxylesterase